MTAIERLETIAAAKRDPQGFYIAQIDQPHGKRFADVVGRFQEGFLADRVTGDLEVAFDRAVEAAARLMPVIKSQAAA